MGLNGLQFQPRTIKFTAGLQTKGDQRADDPPGLDIAQNVEFDDIGGLRTRKPYSALGLGIVGGGTVTNPRAIYANGSGLILQSLDTLYTWSASQSGWIPRATHLAVEVDEQTVFATNDDQINPDRGELNGVVFYCWDNGTDAYLAASDKASGQVLQGPKKFANCTKCRLVICQTRVLFFFNATSVGLQVLALDPANIATSITVGPSTIVASGSYGSNYDVVPYIGSDAAVGAYTHATNTSYTAFTITSGLALATASPTRTADGPVAIACSPDAAYLQIVRTTTSSETVIGDLLSLPTLADVFVNQMITGGTSSVATSRITAAYSSVKQSGNWACYIYWSIEGYISTLLITQLFRTTINTGNTGAGSATLAMGVGVGSHAFDHNGHVYVWGAWGASCTFDIDPTNLVGGIAPQLQNAYFLFRDDGLLCAKATSESAGGWGASTGHVPSVSTVDGATYSWCGTTRRKIQTGAGNASGAPSADLSFAERAPRDISFTFDSPNARRMTSLGGTTYIAAGEVLGFDGVQLAEVGFHVHPYRIAAGPGGTGNLATALYAYKGSYRWLNGAGESDRGTSLCLEMVNINAGPEATTATVFYYLTITHKQGVAVELWRTPGAPTNDSPFYLVTGIDPKVTTGANCYIPNSTLATSFPSTFVDALADESLTTLETFPETGGVLENLAPPAATIIASSPTRVFLAGVAGQPDTVWYSKQRDDGYVASFNDQLTVPLPARGGDITALAYCFETLIAFRERAIYQLPGTGYDNTGGGSNYGPAQLISSDVGAVSAESVGFGPFGIIFKSLKGWYRIGSDLSPQYIGAPVAKFDAETVMSVTVIETQHQVRILTSARMLMFDYLVNEWGDPTITNGVSATLWDGQYVYLDSTLGPMLESPDFSIPTGYGMDVELAWDKPNDQQGRVVLRSIQVLGEYRSPCAIRIRVARDYQSDGAGGWAYYDDYTWVATPTVVGGPIQFRHGPSQKRCESIKVRLTVYATDGVSPCPGEGVKLTGLVFDVAPEAGIYGQLPAGQRV